MKGNIKTIFTVITCLILCCFLFQMIASAYTIPWNMDNSELQNELYDIIGTAENELVPGNHHSDEYLVTMNKILPLAANVYNDRSSTDEELKNAIKGVTLAINGAEYAEIIVFFNTTTDATEVQNPTTVVPTELPTQETTVATEPPVNDNTDEYGFPKFDANLEVPFRFDNTETQTALYELIISVDNMFAPGNNYLEDYRSKVILIRNVAATVYNDNTSTEEELQNAIIGLQMAIDDKDLGEIAKFFGMGSTENTEPTEPVTETPTEPIQETTAPTEPPINDNTDEYGFPKFDANVEVPFRFDNSETQMALYELIVSVDNMFAPGNNYPEDYRSKVILIRNVAATVYNDNASTEEELQNAIIGLQMAIDDRDLSEIATHFRIGVRYKRGDADGDGEITILDATTIQRRLAAYSVANPNITDTYGDVTGDGLDILDATCIQRHLVGLPTVAGIGEYV